MANIPVREEGDTGSVPVRRRRSKGSMTETVSVSVPKPLNQRINGIIATSEQSRSMVITDLVEDGFKYREQLGAQKNG